MQSTLAASSNGREDCVSPTTWDGLVFLLHHQLVPALQLSPSNKVKDKNVLLLIKKVEKIFFFFQAVWFSTFVFFVAILSLRRNESWDTLEPLLLGGWIFQEHSDRDSLVAVLWCNMSTNPASEGCGLANCDTGKEREAVRDWQRKHRHSRETQTVSGQLAHPCFPAFPFLYRLHLPLGGVVSFWNCSHLLSIHIL